MNSFYVTLPSNVKDIQNKNTISNYITKLASVIRLNSQWEVGLSEFIYKKSWFNIENPQPIALIDERGKIYRDRSVFIENGYYANPKNLIDEINFKINVLKTIKIGLGIFSQDHFVSPMLIFENKRHKTKQVNGQINEGKIKIAVDVVLSEEVSKILGMNRYITIYDTDSKQIDDVETNYELIKDTLIYQNETDIDAGRHSLYVYCDIIKPSFVGDTYAKLLRAITVPNVQFGESVQVTFNNPHYYQLNSNEINSIEIDIKDDIGENIKFRFGRVITVLHFRKNESN